MSRQVLNWVMVSISLLVLLTPAALPQQQEAVTADAKQQATLKLAQQVRSRSSASRCTASLMPSTLPSKAIP